MTTNETNGLITVQPKSKAAKLRELRLDYSNCRDMKNECAQKMKLIRSEIKAVKAS